MLAAKVQPPVRRPDTLVRSRLIDALHEHVDRKLQIVIAPAGFGKTTLLLDFVHDAAPPTCWLNLDSGDRDLVAFIEGVVEAFRRGIPSFGRRTLAAVQAGPDVERRRSALARVLAAELEERVETLTLLVLDDFHEVNDCAPVVDFLDDLLHVLPDSVRIVLAGRALPNLTVSRLIVEGQLFGLGEADLRFTPDELHTLLRRHHQQITTEHAASLTEGADGWIAGFLLSVPRLWEGLIGGMIAARGGEGPLYDYLAAEAFDRQPAAVQWFLLATSVPETCDLEIGEALLGPGDWAAMRDTVEGAGLFLTRLGGGGFRYHQLFRGFLQSRLQRTDPAAYKRLHTAAARHLAGRGLWQPALRHFREAGEPGEAAALAARIAPEMERTGRWRALIAVVSDLPPGAAADHPGLLVAAARASIMTGDFARGERLAMALQQAGTRLRDGGVEAWGFAFLGTIRRLQGRTREALDILYRAVRLAPEDGEMAAHARRNIGVCLGMQGDIAGAVAQMQAALAYYDRAGIDYEAALTEMGLGTALQKSGRLPEAAARFESALERLRRLGDAGMEAEILNCLGAVYADRGDYTGARARLDDGLRRARAGGYPRSEGNTLCSLGDVLLTAGEIVGAHDAFQRALAIMQDLGELWSIALLHDRLALAAAFAGDLMRAEEHAHRAVALAQRQESAYLEARCSLTLGAIQLRAGRAEGLAALQAAAGTLAGINARRELMHAQLWLAQAQHARDEVEASRDHLRGALRIAADFGSDAALHLHARWDPTLFAAGAAEGIEPARLGAALERARVAPDAAARTMAADLPALAARAFGPGAVTLDGEREVDWTWDKARELFFFLLHSGPRRQEQLTAALWPDAPAAKAKSGLYNAVFRLRRVVHPEVIVRRDGVYRINDEMVTSYDAREFERHLAAASGAAGEAAAERLQQAVDRYAAPFLDGLDTGWAEGERRRLEARYHAALEQLTGLYTAAGRPHDAIATARRLLALDPLREEVHACLIRAHLRLGDHIAASLQYEHCARLLREEIGVEPGPELQSLTRRINLSQREASDR